ncbi:phytanoyl-CoA dioxygenase family protein [Pelagibacteraceae bacterium]|jgi:hypothetical protein|nr:phytanoyl-CoA dioxygenase family protein [Pelagibacteraceae bacterium]
MTNLSPYIESADFKVLSNFEKNNNMNESMNMLNEKGYCVIDLDIVDLIDKANQDVAIKVEEKSFKTNSAAYHYNESPRIVEGWKFSDSIKKIATSERLVNFLRDAYKSEPIPFSTINFLKGTEQPLHSDEFHFGSIPHRYLSGCWIALEDIDPDSGPLSIAEKSHKLPIFSFEMLNIDTPKSEKDFKIAYTMYESWVKEQIKKNNFKISTPVLKKGQCLIWLSNLLHGSYEIKNRLLTRKSLVVHYHYEACQKIFYPSYSNLEKKRYIPRSLKNLDIRKN